MKGFSGFKSPLKQKDNKKNYNFNKTADYKTAKPDSFGGKIANAVTPKKFTDMIPMGKAVKAGKAIYNYVAG